MTISTKSNNKNKSQVKTFGCRLNLLESELIQNKLENSNNHNLLVVNTCAVTNEAEKQAKQFIRKVSRENPEKKIIVTGCAAQINSKNWTAMPEVYKVVGNIEKLEQKTWDKEVSKETIVSNIMKETKAKISSHYGYKGRTRAFLEIQQGCDHRCTFCIIPYGRGNSRSLDMESIIQNAKKLVDYGHKEIVLTGVDITSWGRDVDEKMSLGYLVKKILSNVKELKRLRLSSIDPAEVDEDLMYVLANEERLMPHLHLSIQHGDDLILKRMKRRHLARDVIRFVEQAKKNRPGLVLGADFISGFPTETKTAHQSNLNLINEIDVCWGHVFPFSPREGTPAASMPQLKVDIRKSRAKELRLACEQNTKNWLIKQIGSFSNVLMESNLTGRCEYFSNVKISNEVEPGSIQKVKINYTDGLFLKGKPIKFKEKLYNELV